MTPAEAAAAMLEAALAAGDLVGRRVADLGCGTGRLALGAALLGAGSVHGIDGDSTALGVAATEALRLRLVIDLQVGPVESFSHRVDTVLMNPPFGAQRKGADRPFWAKAHEVAGSAIYAFALRASRTFIAKSAVARGVLIEATRPVPWDLPRTFPHHRKERSSLAVDLWVLRVGDPA